MARRGDSSWLLYLGLAGAAYLIYQKSGIAAATTPTPYSIYPEFAYTAQTTMAATPAQQASTAKIPPQPIPSFTSVQQQEQAALMSQCAGSWPGCTNLLADTSLGF